MSAKTSIEWTTTVHPDGTVTPGSTWNPVSGCSKVSPGCTGCYAEALSTRFGWTTLPWTARNAAENVRLHPDRLDLPLRWREPRRIFANSMSDLFHEQVPFEFIQSVFEVMDKADRHTFLVLTKRPERMRDVLVRLYERSYLDQYEPLPNVWIGVSAEDQRRADERLPLLLDTPAAIRWVSAEPLLGPLDLMEWLPGLDWVVGGGESGANFRPCDPAWLRSLRNQCLATGTAFFCKQGAARLPGRPTGDPDLDGCKEFPEVMA